MTTELVKQPTLNPDIVQQVLLGGDLSRLTAEQRVSYYNRVCETLGLNPLTQPFAYIRLNGKEVLYAKKADTRHVLSIFYVAPHANAIAPEVQAVLDRLDQVRARAMLVYTNYLSARLFRVADHRENVLRGLLTLLVDRFGPAVIPEELDQSVPALVAALAGGPNEQNGGRSDRAATASHRSASG